jgi:hypothetical protein
MLNINTEKLWILRLNLGGGGQSLPLTFFEEIFDFSKKKFKAMFFQKGIKKLFYRGICVK